MAPRRTPDRVVGAEERFRLLTVERFTSDTQTALWHGHSRNARVAKVLIYMAAIRMPGRQGPPLRPHPNVTCKGAGQQFFRASGENEAAHLLPGQILIDGQEPWHFLQGEPARLLKNEFGYVEPIHAYFNNADWWAEENGMKDVFAAACEAVLLGTGEPDRDIADAYSQKWKEGALAAITIAEHELRAKPLPPMLMLDQDGSFVNLDEHSAAMEDRGISKTVEILSKLDYYRASFDVTPREIESRAIIAFLSNLVK